MKPPDTDSISRLFPTLTGNPFSHELRSSSRCHKLIFLGFGLLFDHSVSWSIARLHVNSHIFNLVIGFNSC